MALAIASIAWGGSARADGPDATATAAGVSGWAEVGGGVLGWRDSDNPTLAINGTMTIDMGVGTSDQRFLVAGGLFRIQPVFGQGVDLALLARLCNSGFQTGWVGFAIDAGAYQRTWGLLSTGFMGEAVLGGPLGLQLTVTGSVGTDDARAFAASLGIDFARLTVHRAHLEKWWPNPRPERRMGWLAAVLGG